VADLSAKRRQTAIPFQRAQTESKKLAAKSRAKSRRPKLHAPEKYVLEDQIGFLLRQANQRHTAIFANRIIENLTTTQFAALAKLYQVGPCSQNRLGRLTAMDAATIKGVVDRLTKRGFTAARPDPQDTRLLILELTKTGLAVIENAIPAAVQITEQTLDPLSSSERALLLRLIRKIGG
jgi:MarR family transcriptional regulator, lower aerobic nicotinate degradation pathway regulator